MVINRIDNMGINAMLGKTYADDGQGSQTI
jgi:hypothetical protein